MFSFETHRLLGLYSLVLMILVTFSGVYISKPNWFQRTVPSVQAMTKKGAPQLDMNDDKILTRPAELPARVEKENEP